mmetsp:Transcript_826/g.2550  ORF Transcript_826/g.2550 Transcript_826/m.2550 type:complete len:383 (-) Transcript_826:2354-3502(-)
MQCLVIAVKHNVHVSVLVSPLTVWESGNGLRQLGLHILILLPLLRFLLDLTDNALGAEILLVNLLEVERSVVKRLVVVLLVHLSPHTVHLGLDMPPLGVLLFQPLVDNGDRVARNAPEQVQNSLPMFRINLLDTANVNRAQEVIRQGQRPLCLVRESRDLLSKLIQHLDRCRIALDAHLQFKPIILAPEERFLILVPSQKIPSEGILRTSRKRHPVVIQHASKHGLQLWALVLISTLEGHLWVVSRQLAVRGGALLATCEVKVRNWPSVVLLSHRDRLQLLLHFLGRDAGPGRLKSLAVLAKNILHTQVQVHALAPRQKVVESLNKVRVLANNVVHQALQLHLADNLLAEDVQALEEVLVSFLAPQTALYALKELQLLAKGS